MIMENVQLLYEIRRIYNDYLTETNRLETVRKPTDGLLGFGKGPGSDACHDRFSEQLEKVLDEIETDEPSSGAAFAVLGYVYEAPLVNKDNTLAYWMLLAVHALTEKLIRFLSPEDAAVLTERYREAYPIHTRLPAQKKIASKLQTQAGGCAVYNALKRKSLLDIIRGRDCSR